MKSSINLLVTDGESNINFHAQLLNNRTHLPPPSQHTNLISKEFYTWLFFLMHEEIELVK